MRYLPLLLVLCSGCSKNHGTELKFKQGQLFYTSAVTREEADRLGNYLVKTGYFGDRPVTVQLNKVKSTYEFRFLSEPGVAEDPRVLQKLRGMARTLSRDVFDDQRVVVHLCDKNLVTLTVADPADDHEGF